MKEEFCTLLILDGFGERIADEGNAIAKAGIPYINSLKEKYPYTTLGASEEDVGIIEGQMGDSEVGHMNIGAGRVVMQNLLKINNAIKDGSFFENENINKIMQITKEKGSDLHLMGLVSDGGVHSHYKHLFAYLDLAKKYDIKNVYIHVITDGRDTEVTSGKGYIKILQDYIKETGIGKIASLSGRLYAMDRELNWDRTKQYYDAVVYGDGKFANSIEEAIENSYSEGITDEFVLPHVILDNGKSHTIKDGDSLIMFNYRKDRPRQIIGSLVLEKFDGFKRKEFKDLAVLTTTNLNPEFDVLVAYEDVVLDECIAQVISESGNKLLKVAETTKYAHVTYYLNGTVEPPFEGEDRKLFDSDKVKNFAEKPLMQASKIADYTSEAIKSHKYKFIAVNIANGDMIGHTGDMKAAITTVAEIDRVVKQLVETTLAENGAIVVTADHGNIDEMINARGEVSTAHSLSRVPFILVSEKFKDVKLQEGGKLANIAPTILKVLDIEKSPKMTDPLF